MLWFWLYIIGLFIFIGILLEKAFKDDKLGIAIILSILWPITFSLAIGVAVSRHIKRNKDERNKDERTTDE